MKKNNTILLAILALSLAACGRFKDLQNDSDADESMAEIAAGALGGAANATESDGSYQAAIQKQTVVGAITDFLTPVKDAFAAAFCPTVRTATCGDDGVIILEYHDCTFGGPGIWNGSQKLEFSSLATCQARSGAKGIPTSGTLLRTFGGNQNADPTTRSVRDRKVILDTETAAGYEVPVSGGTFVEFGLTSENQAQRIIDIRGLNLVAVVRNRNLWNVSISTQDDKPIKVIGVAANKEIPEGSLVVQHNIAKFTASSEIVEPLKFAADCCHPVAGSVQTVFTGSKSGSETVSFSNECGMAVLKAEDGSEANIQLRHCF